MNPFSGMAGNATRHTQKKIERAAKQPMVPTPREKDQYDKRKQLQLYKQWKRRIREGLAAGDYGVEVIMLMRLLRRTPDAATLLAWVQGSKWLLNATEQVRYEILGYIGHSLIRWNIRHGLPPFDDALPGMPLDDGLKIRNLLIGGHK